MLLTIFALIAIMIRSSFACTVTIASSPFRGGIATGPAGNVGTHNHGDGEVGTFNGVNGEKVRATAEFDVSGLAMAPVLLRIVVTNLEGCCGSGSQPALAGDVDVFSYQGNNALDDSDFQIATELFLGTFTVTGATVGQVFTLDATAALANAINLGHAALGIRMQRADQSVAGAMEFDMSLDEIAPSGTPCSDGNDCTESECNGAGVCDQVVGFVAAGTSCSDTDGNGCTESECDGAGTCDQLAKNRGGGSSLIHEDFGTVTTSTLPTGWTRAGARDMWRLREGSTTSTATGPSGGANPVDGATQTTGNAYAYAETSSPSQLGDVDVLLSPVFAIGQRDILTFQYHMFGADMGSLDVAVEGPAGAGFVNVASFTGQQQTGTNDNWLLETIDLAAVGVTGTVQVRFTATRGSSFNSDMAIDNVQLVQCNCPAVGAAVDNGAGDCICPAGDTDEGGTCAVINFDQCVVPAIGGSCDAGQLQAGSFCFDFDFEGDGGSGVIDTTSITLDGDACSVINGIFDQTDEFVSAATLDCAGRIIEWFPTGDANDCTVTVEVDMPNDRKKRQTTPMPGVTAGGAVGDPHLQGAHGEKFDFFGVDGGIYNLFSTKQFVINVLLGKEAKNHYIKHVGVCFRGKCEQFDLAGQRNPRGYINQVKNKFAAVGGGARFPLAHAQQPMSLEQQLTIEIDLCQGHRIVLEKKVTTHGKLAGVHYFDVEIEVPGCHDNFDGALGQTYKCKYAGEHKEKFVFQKSMEEHFRVKSLTSQFGLYNSTMVAPCQSVESFNTQGKSVSGKAHH